MASPDPVVCVVVKAWPLVTTTFIAQELVGLEREGLKLWVAATVHGDKVRHKLHDQLRAPVQFLAAANSLPRLLKAWRKLRRTPGYAHAKALLRHDRSHGASPMRLVAFAGATVLAGEMPRETGIIYAHFLNSGMNVARYAAAITGLPVAVSAHARDIWVSAEWNKRAKLEQAAWCTTCTQDGYEHLRALADDPAKVHLIRHGLSFDRFPADAPAREARDGSDPQQPVRLLSVGRAVEKKGFDVLLDALGELPRDLHWRWMHVGSGPIIEALKERARSAGIADRLEWRGVQSQAEVINLYRSSDLFVLPSREGADGDRDGLPNVLMEAQSQGLACLSTRFSAIPELIVDGETGLLVPPGETAPLGDALARLIADPRLREQLGMAGYRRVRSDFVAEVGIRQIAELLRGAMQR
ncbi:MAG TPA: glycosyltransferase family 4 protein [Sphingomicrobium sp.]|nr:glycosyltransferase family 4 protein [Sphingomicrobium sp.]